MLKLIEKYYLNPIFIYIVSFLTVFTATGFDTTNLVGVAVFSIFAMIPISITLGAIAGFLS